MRWREQAATRCISNSAGKWRAKQRSEEEWCRAFLRHGHRVLATCRWILHHRQNAEDACQVVFVKLLESADTLGHVEDLGYWLRGVAFGIALNLRRSRKRRQRHEAKAAASRSTATDQPDDEARLHEIESALETELQRLPETLRAVFVLCALEGASKREVAEQLGWPQGTVASRLRKARKILQRRMTNRGIIP